MLRRVHLHVHPDDNQQASVEESLSASLNERFRLNSNAFKRHASTVLETLQSSGQGQNAILGNKYGELNIVDMSVGRTVYDFHPEEDIAKEYALAQDNAQQYPLTSSGIAFSQTQSGMSSDVIVCLGVGLGYHVAKLVQDYKPKHLILYEPRADYFKCSLYSAQWDDILSVSKRCETNIYFVIAQPGFTPGDNLQELIGAFDVTSVSIYKHLNNEGFNTFASFDEDLSFAEIDLAIKKAAASNRPDNFYNHWSSYCDPSKFFDIETPAQLFESNLAAFKQYFPDIYTRFSDYTPQLWHPKQNADQQVNLFNSRAKEFLYGEQPRQECFQSIEGFSLQPHKDGLILGYQGKKLKSYLHYQFVQQAEKTLEDLGDAEGQLPQTIKSMLIFGLGAGYQLDYLIEHHALEKLFICEPNADLFYASLFAIDWSAIFESIDNIEGRLYINIGASGSDLMHDLMAQFYAAGPYVLANTYIYQGYYNEQLEDAIAQVREQLRVIISLGDYFDHARFGLAHTKHCIQQEVPFLIKGAANHIPQAIKEVPVFVVGNGPSLDFLIEQLKEHAENAIIISCGTALQVLYKNGICPDFHAEIEQNRATFDWIAKIGDFDYLKRISLLSTNGIHPDTCTLFKDTWLSFKDGESSTVAMSEIVGRTTYETLELAFPTVSNFTLDMFLTLGFTQVYLWGVDLGFIDAKHHHSKSSGYFNTDGEQCLDFSEHENVHISVQGNFRPSVFTKYEFKFSASIIEQALGRRPVDCYNLNDGARLRGATPLDFDSLLTMPLPLERDDMMATLKASAFKVIPVDTFFSHYKKRFDDTATLRDFERLTEALEKPSDSREDFEALIDQQRQILVDALNRGDSEAFYLLYGSLNYVNSVLTKVLYASEHSDLSKLVQLRDLWSSVLAQMVSAIRYEIDAFDCISSYGGGRHNAFMKRLLSQQRLALKNHEAVESFNDVYEIVYRLGAPTYTVVTDRKGVIFASSDTVDLSENINDYIVLSDLPTREWLAKVLQSSNVIQYSPGSFLDDGDPLNGHDPFRALIATIYATVESDLKVVLPKLVVDDEAIAHRWYSAFLALLPADLYVYDMGKAIGFATARLNNDKLLMPDGFRAQRIIKPYDDINFMARLLHKHEVEEFRRITINKFPSLRKEHADV